MQFTHACTQLFARRKVHPGRCLTITSSKGCLDLEAPTTETFRSWMCGLREMLIDAQKFKANKTFTPDCLRLPPFLHQQTFRIMNDGSLNNPILWIFLT